MDNTSVRDMRNFLHLSAKQPRMHLLDEPTGYASAMGKANLSHQMRYSAERLEADLTDGCEPRVLQLVCEGDEREPKSRALYADGLRCAHGAGDFALTCFYEAAETFMDVCREAAHAVDLPPLAARTTTSCYVPPAGLQPWRWSAPKRKHRGNRRLLARGAAPNVTAGTHATVADLP